jgi:hypothetical protein
MCRLWALLFLLFSTVTEASFSFPSINWTKLSETEREYLLLSYKEAIMAQSSSSCLPLGWPTKKDSNKKCADPALTNSSYKNHNGCARGERLCSPVLFGEAICVEEGDDISQCDRAFQRSRGPFSRVVEGARPEELKTLMSVVHDQCNKDKSLNASCMRLHESLDLVFDNPEPAGLKNVKNHMKDDTPEKLLAATKVLQKEMEKDLSDFKKKCERGVGPQDEMYCKNHSLRVKKSIEAVGESLNRLKGLAEDPNCAPGAFGSADDQKLLAGIKCAAKKDDKKCAEELKCVIASTALSSVTLFREVVLKEKPAPCLNTQNNCIANVISSLVKSLVSLVTGIWDLLGLAVNWAGDKLGQFWDYVKGIEDKTADAQHVLNKLSPEDLKQVKTNPVDWIKNLATNIWEGTNQWLKEDIFCEKWEGVPRASKCVTPSEWGCMSCGTKFRGACSAVGVIAAEVVPAFLTGGAVNLVSRAGTGAKSFLNVIKASKNYQKAVSGVEKLTDIKAVELTLKAAKAPVNVLSKSSQLTLEVMGQSFKKLTGSEAFKATSRAMDKAAKYTGLKLLNHVNEKMYKHGYDFVDSVTGKKSAQLRALKATKAAEAEAAKAAHLEKFEDNIEELMDQSELAGKKGSEVKNLEREIQELEKTNTPENLTKIADLRDEIVLLQSEINGINHSFIQKLEEVYKGEGIPHRIYQEPDGSIGLMLDFSTPAVDNRAFEKIRKFKEKFKVQTVTVSLKDNAKENSLGFFQSYKERMEIGPNQALGLLEDYTTLVTKHEARHAMFNAKRLVGEDSLYHLSFSSPKKGGLNDFKVYDEYMSAEEIYNHSTDLQTYAQLMKGEVTEFGMDLMLSKISNQADMVRKLSSTGNNVSQGMISSLDDVLKNENYLSRVKIKEVNKGNVSLRFEDADGREVNVMFVTKSESDIAKGIKIYEDRIAEHRKKMTMLLLKREGINIPQFMTKLETRTLSKEEFDLYNRLQKESLLTSEGKRLRKDLDAHVEPLLKKAREKLVNLSRLSVIQEKASNSLMAMIKAHKEKGFVSLEDIKAEMFRIAKNVKEEYSGFALNK